jgi:NAD(P)-dependent dehydrogenase (short-subunit alcohol dehydrogenase family)
VNGDRIAAARRVVATWIEEPDQRGQKMSEHRNGLQDSRILVVGASSGLGREVARLAGRRGARIAVASRRLELLRALADEVHGTAHFVDVTSPSSITQAVSEADESLGGIDVLVCTCGVFPLARVEHVDGSTWAEAFAVNTIGPALVMSAALPHLSEDAVALVASSDKVGSPPAGAAAHSASKAALDEILRSWRLEHPDLRVMRLGIGPTAGTELMRGADLDLVSELLETWTRDGRVPEEMADVTEVAGMIVELIVTARDTGTVVAESVQFRPRMSPRRDRSNIVGA